MAEKENNAGLGESFSRAEQYIIDNKKSLSIIFGVILVTLLGYFGYQKFIVAPNELAAEKVMFMAEQNFEKDSLDLAINGKDVAPGFKEIASKYSGTKSGNLAKYYLGICYLKKGMYQEAIESLNSFNGSDEIVAPIAIGGIGDAYSEMGKSDDAIKYYLKAASKAKNKLTSPIYLMKAAGLYEDGGKYDKAIELYQQIRKDFYETQEGREADKYIARAEGMKK
ncbi:MAG: tetratricopeptide repeat protein [Bacteroidota bacterium]